MKSNHVFLLVVVAIAIGGLVLLRGIQQGWFESEPDVIANVIPQPKSQTPSAPIVKPKPLTEVLGVSEEDMVDVGGGVNVPSATWRLKNRTGLIGHQRKACFRIRVTLPRLPKMPIHKLPGYLKNWMAKMVARWQPEVRCLPPSLSIRRFMRQTKTVGWQKFVRAESFSPLNLARCEANCDNQ